MKVKNWIWKNTWIWAVLGMFALWMLISVLAGKVSLQTFLMNATLATFLVLLSLGQMLVITSGDGAVDLSLPYTLALAAFISSNLMAGGGANFYSGLIITIAICLGIGLFNGLITVYLEVPAMITTLAMGDITYTGVLIFSQNTLGTPDQSILEFAKWSFKDISSLFLLCIAVVVIFAVVMTKSVYGKKLHAIGQSGKAAGLASINVKMSVILAFMLSSALGAVVGILLCGYSDGATIDMGSAFSITPIAATLIGGTLISGGKSSVIGTLAGGLMLTLLVTFITLTQLPRGYQYLIQGAILIFILSMSKKKEKGE